jgi:hypothetical protein
MAYSGDLESRPGPTYSPWLPERRKDMSLPSTEVAILLLW